MDLPRPQSLAITSWAILELIPTLALRQFPSFLPVALLACLQLSPIALLACSVLATLRVDFHCRVIYTCVYTHLNF